MLINKTSWIRIQDPDPFIFIKILPPSLLSRLQLQLQLQFLFLHKYIFRLLLENVILLFIIENLERRSQGGGYVV